MVCVDQRLGDDEGDLGLRQMGGVRRRKLGHTGKARQDRQAMGRDEGRGG